MSMTETQLEEQKCLPCFAELGWEVFYGKDIAPKTPNAMRQSYTEVLLQDVLVQQLERLNPHLPPDCLSQVVHQLRKPSTPDLLANNRTFHKQLLEGVTVHYKENGDSKEDTAFLVDFECIANNRFMVVNQFKIIGTKQKRIPDVICFVNGIPLAVIELKSPNDENVTIWDAYHQLQTYKDEISDLFIFNEALVISDGTNARLGSLTANTERFMPWRRLSCQAQKPPSEWELETLIRSFFQRDLFLEYIRYFVLFENDSETWIKKIAGYHQFDAVRQAVASTIKASTTGTQKAGVVWHTQGSGKSISMCCYAGMLVQQKEMNNPTLLFVTDRNDLDGQLFKTFSDASMLLKQKPVQVADREDLRQVLDSRDSGGIIFTTIQKFSTLEGEEQFPVLNKRRNIVVISDEAHRSQYGFKATLTKEGIYKYGYAKHLRDALPNASFLGFTGTPISQDDKDTQAVFGAYVSIYDIEDAVKDKATVPIYYESRLAKLDINNDEIETLNQQVEEVMEDEEDLSTREKAKGHWSRLEKLVGAKPRLEKIAQDIVSHFEKRHESMDGKAMIVTMSREICVRLYDAIVALRPEWHDVDPLKGSIKVIMTGSASDQAFMQAHIYNKKTKEDLQQRFKNVNDPLEIVIVRDMWLTGFDAPCCTTMYVDKPMKGHNLMQAIARVNRVFKDKQGGLVVDYIGMLRELEIALKDYTDSKGKGRPTWDAEEAFRELLKHHNSIRNLFSESGGFDYSAYETKPCDLLIPALEFILSLKDGKKRFMDAVLGMTKAYSLCSTLDQVKPLQKEMAFFTFLKTTLSKYTTIDKKRTQEEQDSALKQILDNALISDGVADVFDLCGLNKPNIALLSDEFLEDVRLMPSKNLAVALLEKLLKDAIKSKEFSKNIVNEKKYSDRLLETLNKYNKRSIETSKIIEELIQMAKDFQNDLIRNEALGLNSDELAFYDALAKSENAVHILGDATLKKIAKEITELLKKKTKLDWQVHESVRAELRILVKRSLKKYKYPPDYEPEATNAVLEQAEVLSNEWSS